MLHTLTHPGRNIRQFVTIVAALGAAALVAIVLVFTLSDQLGRGGAEVQPPRVEAGNVTAGERTAAYQAYLDRLQEANTGPQERTAGERTAAYQAYLDRLQEANTGPQERTIGERTAAYQAYLDRLQEANTTP